MFSKGLPAFIPLLRFFSLEHLKVLSKVSVRRNFRADLLAKVNDVARRQIANELNAIPEHRVQTFYRKKSIVNYDNNS